MDMWKIAMCDSLHDISSDISPQSSSRSQLQARGIHRPFLQEKWSAWQGWAEEDERSHSTQSHMHKSMRDPPNISNDHYISRMLVSIQCKLFNHSHSVVLLLDGPPVTCYEAMVSTHREAHEWCLVGYLCQTNDEETFISLWLMLTDWSSTDKKAPERHRRGCGRQRDIL